MSKYVQWDQIGSNGKTERIKLKGGVTCSVRPIKTPICFRKLYFKKNGKMRTAIVDDVVAAELVKKYPDDLKIPPYRFVMFAIDRLDSKIKIMEFPLSVYNGFREHFEATGKKPGSKNDGGDFRIKVTGTGLLTKYTTTYLKDAPLTQEELSSYIEESEEGKEKEGENKLIKIYKFCTLSEAEARLFSEDTEADQNSSEDLPENESSGNESNSSKTEFNW